MKVLVGMSGGVDSSVAAVLLQRAGHEVVGVTLRLADGLTAAGDAGGSDRFPAADDARRVCDALGMEHVVCDLSDEFERDVVHYFVSSYGQGLTPNPCIECNRTVKFPGLLRVAHRLDCDAVATGHYARVGRNAETGRIELRRALDASKDQSYVLYALDQDILSCCMLPLGGLTKALVRDIAAASHLIVADKPDSQDICFIPSGDHVLFLKEHGAVSRSGEIVDTRGAVLGRHGGLIDYTVGQRKGIDVPASSSASLPWYVKEKDAASNRLVVGHACEVKVGGCTLGPVNWVSSEGLAEATGVQVKTRYRQRPIPSTFVPGDAVFAAVSPTSGSETGAQVVFDEAQAGVAPGQSCVLYDGDLVLGGGIIVEAG